MTMPSHLPVRAFPVESEDRVAQRRRGRVGVRESTSTVTPPATSTSRRSSHAGRTERVRVAPHEQRTGDPLLGPVLDDRLRDGEDVSFVERAVEAGNPRCPDVPKTTC
jgi:hypothetical protein